MSNYDIPTSNKKMYSLVILRRRPQSHLGNKFLKNFSDSGQSEYPKKVQEI